MNVLILNASCEHSREWEQNQGNKALVTCTISSLRGLSKDVQLATYIQFSERFAAENEVRIIRNKVFRMKTFSMGGCLRSTIDFLLSAAWFLVHRYLRADVAFLLRSRKLREVADSDVIVHLGTNLYSDDFGWLGVLEHSKEVLSAVLLNKPVVMYSESIGPFKSPLTRWLAKKTLKRVALITLREPHSLAYLREIGITKPPMEVTADPAVLMEPAADEVVKKILASEGVEESHRPLIGVSISAATSFGQSGRPAHIKMLSCLYSMLVFLLPESAFSVLIKIMKRTKFFARVSSKHIAQVEPIVQLVEQLIDQMGGDVVFVPHVQQEGTIFEDRAICNEIRTAVRNSARVNVLQGSYTPPELKGIIGRCDLFVTSRMHAGIAALSQGVPTVLLPVASQRHHGIMDYFGQQAFICRNGMNPETIQKLVNRAWAERMQIRQRLLEFQPSCRAAAMRNVELVKGIHENGRVEVR